MPVFIARAKNTMNMGRSAASGPVEALKPRARDKNHICT